MVRKIPMRQCTGCREMKEKRSLIRVVLPPDGAITLDSSGKSPGRGAYLGPDPACLAKARKSRALERALDTAIPPEIYETLAARLQEGGSGDG